LTTPTKVQPRWNQGWFNFTTPDYTVMVVLIVTSGIFQYAWSAMLGANVLGPLSFAFAAYGFNVAAFVVAYFVPVPGAATAVKFFGAIVEVLLGNPFGPIAIFYGTVEGIAVDVMFVAFGRKLSLNMFIAASLLAWLFAAPVDAIRDAVPITYEGLLAYFGPGFVSRFWISWLCWATVLALARFGIKRNTQPQLVEETIKT
jgi:ABC-type thiamin/hydroxymethylpyrimidine transport system permease subunit